MEHSRTDIYVGSFVLVGILALGYLSLSIGGLKLLPAKQHILVARFAEVGSLGQGAPIRMAGVTIGRVESISLENYTAMVRLGVDQAVPVPADTIASIRTAGLLGETYISLSPGSSERDLTSGDRIMQTEPAIDLLDLLENYAFGGTGIEEQEGASSEPFKDPLE